MNWNIIKSDVNKLELKDATRSTVQSSSLSRLEIFVREVLQNSLDNGIKSEDPIRVDFHIRYLIGEKKLAFLESLRLSEYESHLDAARDRQVKDRGNSILTQLESLKDPNEPLKLLFIEDHETKGLIGAESPAEAETMEGPHCFVGLCRNTGDNQKEEEAAGGTNGFGKIVLWKASRQGVVLFYSHLSEPHKSHDYRLFGQQRLNGHFIDDKPYTGSAFFGNQKEELTVSLYDDEANLYREKLHFKQRRHGDTGTTILIVDFDDPDTEDEEETPEHTARGMIKAAEQFFWPAIIDGRLSVRCCYEEKGGNEECIAASPTDRPELAGFLEAYKAAQGRQDLDKNLIRETYAVNVPAGPSQDEKKAEAKMSVGIRKESDPEVDYELNNHIALIRGAGMVVGYEKCIKPINGEDFCSVVLGGKASINGASKAAARCEKLLAYSEPVTHDAWRHDSDNILDSNWWGAKSAVRRLTNAYRNAVKRSTTDETQHQGAAASLLSNLIKIEQGDKIDITRDAKIQNIKGPHIKKEADGKVGTFSFEVIIPESAKFAEPVPRKWRLRCLYSFLGEGGRSGQKVANYKIRICLTKVLLNDKPIEFSSELNKWLEITGDVGSEAWNLKLFGQTEKLNDTLADTSRHDIQIRVDKGYGE